MSREKEFTYIDYKPGVPLTLNGKLKGRPQSVNTHKQSLDESSRKIISSKITKNYQDWKSILPYNEKEQKTKTIRTYQNKQNDSLRDKNVPSGAALLMNKQPVGNNKGRKFIQQPNICRKNICERRHFYRNNMQSPAVLQNFAIQTSILLQQPVIKPQTVTLKKKIYNDIFGYYDKHPISKDVNHRKKNPDRDLFKEGIELGYDIQQQKKLSTMKQAQLMGNYSVKRNANQAQKNNDWRRSSFTLG